MALIGWITPIDLYIEDKGASVKISIPSFFSSFFIHLFDEHNHFKPK